MKKESANIIPQSAWENPIHFIACGFGSGAMPYAPGTFGTLMSIPIYLMVAGFSVWLYSFLLILAIVIGFWLCDVTCKDFGVDDHSAVVWDEFVGFWLTMLAAPKGWMWVVIGFILFRFFDIFKPQPIGYIDKNFKGGIAVIADDLLAGLFAWIALQFIYWLVK